MSHFAHLDRKDITLCVQLGHAFCGQCGIVDQVIVIEQDMLNTGAWGNPSEWVQTSYDTSEGKHKLGGIPLRKNYAGIGYFYDKVRDAFIPPCPYPSWVIDEVKGVRVPPKTKPTVVKAGMIASWDEALLDFVEKPSPRN